MAVDQLAWSNLRSTLIQTGVKVCRENEVRSYLERHPDMLAAVEAVCRSAAQEFGPGASLTLEHYRDPEIADERLTLYVRLPSYPPDMLCRIHAVADAHENSLEDKSGTLLVTTDFCPSR